MYGSEEVENNVFQEENGARKALFEAWLENALKELESENAGQSASAERRGTVLELLQKRLEYNIPVLCHLPSVRSFSSV